MSDLDFSHLSPQQLEIALGKPSIPPPPGVVPNFANPENQNAVAAVGLSLSFTLATVFLMLRIYVVFIKMKRPNLGDCRCFIECQDQEHVLVLIFPRPYAFRICNSILHRA